MTIADQALVDWFSVRSLPTGFYQITTWMHTDDLAQVVALAIDSLRRGNTISRDTLQFVENSLSLDPPVTPSDGNG